MLPPSQPGCRGSSISHLESYFGHMELSQKLWFYVHFLPRINCLQGELRRSPSTATRQASWLLGSGKAGLGWAGWLRFGLLLGFRLDLGLDFGRILASGLDFSLILVWLDFALACFRFHLLRFLLDLN